LIFNRGLGTDARCKTQDTRHEDIKKKLDADYADCAEFFRQDNRIRWDFVWPRIGTNFLDADFADFAEDFVDGITGFTEISF